MDMEVRGAMQTCYRAGSMLEVVLALSQCTLAKGLATGRGKGSFRSTYGRDESCDYYTVSYRPLHEVGLNHTPAQGRSDTCGSVLEGQMGAATWCTGWPCFPILDRSSWLLRCATPVCVCAQGNYTTPRTILSGASVSRAL